VVLKLLYIISFCFDDSFDPCREALARSLQRVHIGECRFDSGLERCYIGMSRLVGHSFNDAPHIVIHRIQNCSEVRIPWSKTFPYYPTASFEPRRVFVELSSQDLKRRSSSAIRHIVVSLTRFFANFVRDSSSSEMSSWALSIIAGVLIDFSLEWLFLVGLAELFSELNIFI